MKILDRLRILEQRFVTPTGKSEPVSIGARTLTPGLPPFSLVPWPFSG